MNAVKMAMSDLITPLILRNGQIVMGDMKRVHIASAVNGAYFFPGGVRKGDTLAAATFGLSALGLRTSLLDFF